MLRHEAEKNTERKKPIQIDIYDIVLFPAIFCLKIQNAICTLHSQ